MGAVFAMYAGWYFWIPKITGLIYNILHSKLQFWILFVGVRIKGRVFETGKILYSGSPCFAYPNPLDSEAGIKGSPFNPEDAEFVIFFDNLINYFILVFNDLHSLYVNIHILVT